jgi:murein DD-endopeptidase MepM/ murein hydrolase activator NlpD
MLKASFLPERRVTMTGPSIISKAPFSMAVPDSGQANPTGVAARVLETPRSFQEMLAKAVGPSSVPGTEPSDNKGDGRIGNQVSATSEYTIRQGDTLSEVVAAAMRKQGGSFSRNELYKAVNRVAAASGLANPDQVFPGQKIRLSDMSKAAASTESVLGQAPDFAIVPPAASQGELQAPAHGRLSSRFGMRIHPVFGKEQHHDGIDISLPTGTPVQPVDAGRVTFAGTKGGYGLLVEIDHGNGLTSRYAHLSELLVGVGEEILPGRPLGLVGQTGVATGPHLHLEIRRDHQPINPLLLLSRERIETEGNRNIV